MPRRTDGEKIDETVTVVAVLQEQVKALERQGSSLRNLELKVALLEHRLDKLEMGNEEWGRRAWAIVGPVVGAILGGLVGYFLRK